jgi:integrase
MQSGTLQLLLARGTSTGSFALTDTAEAPTGLESPAAGVPLLAEYAAAWLPGIACFVRPQTLAAYTQRLEQHVLPHLGEQRLDEITVDDILGLIARLDKKGLSGASIRSMLTPLSRLFSHAVRRGVIPANPVSRLDRTERPGAWMSEKRILNRNEIGRLLDSARPQYRTLLATAIFSGLRQSELLGLRWTDIDWAEKVIHVRRAVDRTGRDVPLKTRHSSRDVVLMPALVEALRGHRERSRFKEPEDFVFASRVGTPLHRRNAWRQAFRPAFTKAGIERLRWHDLRHTFASLLIGGGANVVFVSRQLGHGSSDVTLRIYAHLFDHAEQAERTRETLQRTFESAISSAADHPEPGSPSSPSQTFSPGGSTHIRVCAASSSSETS